MSLWLELHGHAGASGNVLIDENADRVNSYNIWNYAEGNDSYYSAMLVDLTQPPDKVSRPIASTSSVFQQGKLR